MTDELYLDPFQRSHVGRHGAFVHRVNQDHVEHCRKAIRQAWAEASTSERVDTKVTKMRRAA